MSAGLSAQQLAEIRARADAATKGPWGTYDDGTGRIDIAADLELTDYGYTCRRGIAQTDDEPIDNDPTHADWDSDDDLEQIEADTAFIAHAREDVPALLAEVERVAAERDQFADRVDTLTAVAKSNKAHVCDLLADLAARDRRIAELENAPLAWTTQLDLKSLDNLLITLSQAADYEPMTGAIDQIHEVLRQFRGAIEGGESDGDRR